MAKSESVFTPVFETALAQQNWDIFNNPAFTVQELHDYALVVLRIAPDPQGANDALARLNISLPAPLQMTGSLATGLVKWIGPSEYWITLPLAQKEAFIHAAKEALQGLFAAVVDNSSSYSLLKLTGSERYEVLSKLSVYDLRGQLPIGKVVSTLSAKTATTFYRLEEDSLMLLVRWSFAAHFMRALERASEEYR